MFFQLLIGQLEIETPNEDFRLRVGELDILFVDDGCGCVVFSLANDVRVWLLDLLATGSRDCLITLIGLE